MVGGGRQRGKEEIKDEREQEEERRDKRRMLSEASCNTNAEEFILTLNDAAD